MRQGWNPPSNERELGRGDWRDGQLERRVIEGAGRFVGIIFPSSEPLVAGDNAGGWFLVIPEDLDGTELVHAHAAVYVNPTGTAVELQVRKGAATDMLSTPITIDAGESTSYTAATPPVIDTSVAVVARGDLIVVDLDDPASSAQGLDIILVFA